MGSLPLHADESREILRFVTTLHPVLYDQVLRLFPGKEKTAVAALNELSRKKRIVIESDTKWIHPFAVPTAPQPLHLECIWVLLDYLAAGKVHYTAAEYPIEVSFFLRGELFDIIPVAEGQEQTLKVILNRCYQGSKRIIVLQSKGQIERLHGILAAQYGIVDRDTGQIQYFRFQ